MAIRQWKHGCYGYIRLVILHKLSPMNISCPCSLTIIDNHGFAVVPTLLCSRPNFRSGNVPRAIYVSCSISKYGKIIFTKIGAVPSPRSSHGLFEKLITLITRSTAGSTFATARREEGSSTTGNMKCSRILASRAGSLILHELFSPILPVLLWYREHVMDGNLGKLWEFNNLYGDSYQHHFIKFPSTVPT